jgi:hypothetical protein
MDQKGKVLFTGNILSASPSKVEVKFTSASDSSMTETETWELVGKHQLKLSVTQTLKGGQSCANMSDPEAHEVTTEALIEIGNKLDAAPAASAGLQDFRARATTYEDANSKAKEQTLAANYCKAMGSTLPAPAVSASPNSTP